MYLGLFDHQISTSRYRTITAGMTHPSYSTPNTRMTAYSTRIAIEPVMTQDLQGLKTDGVVNVDAQVADGVTVALRKRVAHVVIGSAPRIPAPRPYADPTLDPALFQPARTCSPCLRACQFVALAARSRATRYSLAVIVEYAAIRAEGIERQQWPSVVRKSL